jgi:hypothetical protein
MSVSRRILSVSVILAVGCQQSATIVAPDVPSDPERVTIDGSFDRPAWLLKSYEDAETASAIVVSDDFKSLASLLAKRGKRLKRTAEVMLVDAPSAEAPHAAQVRFLSGPMIGENWWICRGNCEDVGVWRNADAPAPLDRARLATPLMLTKSPTLDGRGRLFKSIADIEAVSPLRERLGSLSVRHEFEEFLTANTIEIKEDSLADILTIEGDPALPTAIEVVVTSGKEGYGKGKRGWIPIWALPGGYFE